MIRIRNQQRKIKVNLPRIERTIKRILKALTFPPDAELSLLLVNDRKIKELNSKYRGINRVTDVLSFPANPPPSPLTKGGIKKGSTLTKGGTKKGSTLTKGGTKKGSTLTKGGTKKGSTLTKGGIEGRLEVLGDIAISMPAALRQASGKGITLYEELNLLLIHSILHLLGYTHESDFTARRMRKKEKDILIRI
jgi:probable rRNA maturation factor